MWPVSYIQFLNFAKSDSNSLTDLPHYNAESYSSLHKVFILAYKYLNNALNL